MMKKYIKENSKNPNFRAKDMERDFFYSYTYLCIFMRKHTGLTVKEWMDKYRFERAIYSLTKTNKTITEISENFGLREDAFRKKFKREYGVSPSVYKKQYRLNQLKKEA